MKKYFYTLLLALYSSLSFAQEGMIGEIRLFAGNFAPVNWAFCNGTKYNISLYETLFSLIGTTYGGDGVTTFAIPDLRARVAVGAGQGTGLSQYYLGQNGGSATMTYGVKNLPSHTHTAAVMSSSNAANADSPAGNSPAATSANTYNETSNAEMATNSLAVTLASSGKGQPQNNVQPYLGIHYIVCLNGYYNTIDDPYMGEIKLTALSNIPTGWLPCDGRILYITQNQALYALLGNTYGGDGKTTFALPDLRSRVPIGISATHPRGQIAGTETETITINQMANHSHSGSATTSVYSGIGNADTPVGNYPAINPQRGNEFSTSSTAASTVGTVTTNAVGNGEAISNMQPYTTVQYIIATTGIFPTRD
jgi:microcystin-dependent protein